MLCSGNDFQSDVEAHTLMAWVSGLKDTPQFSELGAVIYTWVISCAGTAWMGAGLDIRTRQFMATFALAFMRMAKAYRVSWPVSQSFGVPGGCGPGESGNRGNLGPADGVGRLMVGR